MFILKVTVALLSILLHCFLVVCDPPVQNKTATILEHSSSSLNESIPLRPASRADRASPRYLVISDQSVDFFEAWQTCLQFGYQLASISSPEESFALRQALALASMPYNAEFWLAGIDLGRFRNFVWITTNKPISRSRYQNWRYGEPNNYGGNERCVQVLNNQDVSWNDVDCAAKLWFICQTKGDSSC